MVLNRDKRHGILRPRQTTSHSYESSALAHTDGRPQAFTSIFRASRIWEGCMCLGSKHASNRHTHLARNLVSGGAETKEEDGAGSTRQPPVPLVLCTASVVSADKTDDLRASESPWHEICYIPGDSGESVR